MTEYKPRDPEVTSRVMSAIRSTNNAAEVALRKALFRRGLRYRVNYRAVRGSPDIAFPRQKVAIFVDGDFWHGRLLRERGVDGFYSKMRTANREWWHTKISKNLARDDKVNAALQEMGWTVLRYWESDLINATDEVAEEVMKVIRNAH